MQSSLSALAYLGLSLVLALAPACLSSKGQNQPDVPPREAARLALLTRDWPTAAEQWSLVALESGDDCTASCLQAAEAFRRIDDIESAQSMLEFGLEREPGSPELHEALGDVFYDMGFSRAAERSYEQALKLDPDRSPVCLKLGRLRLELGLESSALAALNQLVASDRACAETWYLRGAACQARGDYQTALESYAKSFVSQNGEVDPSWRLSAAKFYFSGRGARVSGARALLREWLEPVIEQDPQNSEALFMIGTLRREQGASEQSIEALRRAVEIDPTSFEYVEALAESYLEAGDREQAAAMLDRARALDPERSASLERLLEEHASS